MNWLQKYAQLELDEIKERIVGALCSGTFEPDEALKTFFQEFKQYANPQLRPYTSNVFAHLKHFVDDPLKLAQAIEDLPSHWLSVDRIAQVKYPGGKIRGQDWQGKPIHEFDAPAKMEQWGFPVSPHLSTHDYKTQLAKSPYLARVPVKHISFTINHLAEKYAPEAEEHIIEKTEDWCDDFDDDRWTWNACKCVQGQNQWHSEPNEYEGRCYNFPCYDHGQTGPAASISLGQTLKKMTDEISQTCHNIAQRYEIPDKEFIKNMAAFMEMEVITKISRKTKQSHKNDTFFVRVYGQNKAYGGAEEGGWWYNDKQIIEEQQVKGLQQACQTRAQLTDKYKGKEQDTFHEDMSNLHGGLVDAYNESTSGEMGMGDVGYGINESEGMEIPRGWTTSAFEKFFVQVELSENPTSQTNVTPRFSSQISWLQKFAHPRKKHPDNP